jgi:glycosyltransferase involved in cell wall biosynthesis
LVEAARVSIVVPAFNERATLQALVERVARLPLPKEILVVDDGSRDGTAEVVDALACAGTVVGLHLEQNRGKGAAFRHGLAHATAPVVVIQDADLEYDPDDIPAVVAPILEGRADVCYGSRILGTSEGRSSAAFYWGGRLLSLVTTLLYGVRVTDEATGYKAFRTDALRAIPLEREGFDLEPEITARVLRLGLRYTEVPIRYRPRKPTEGKKIRWSDGLEALWVLFAWRFRRL